jgi:hypothetical protein
LPKRVQEDRDARSSAIIQKPDAGDFPCLLRRDGTAKRKEHGAKSKDRDFFIHVFLFSDPLVTRPFSHDSLRTSFRALCITQIEVKESVILHGERRR